MGLKKKNISLILLWGSLILLLLVPSGVWAFTYDFSGTVLYDNKASNYVRPGFLDAFTGTLELSDTLMFVNSSAETTYEDFGVVTGGSFNQGGQDFFYALSKGDSDHSQMGMVWWSNPKSFRVGYKYFNNVYGLTFYLDGSLLYTPAQLVSMRLANYLVDGYLPTFTGGSSTLYYTGCSLAAGTAFLGIIETPFVKMDDPAGDSSAVPLPASLWFLGSGLLFLMRYRKQ
ncbi:MAG: hypothetical protein DRH07_11085 [Deltaproteobacteria bacterium]|nr:MAG: hypothetical protein DRH07_11085 [Deltaproteobacteria bacterium]